MIIRRQQLDAFSQAVQEDLRCSLVAHVERAFPDEYARLGRAGVERRAEAAIDLARNWNLDKGYGSCQLLDLSFLLPCGLKGLAQSPALAEVLKDPCLDDRAKTDRLCELLGCRPSHRPAGTGMDPKGE